MLPHLGDALRSAYNLSSCGRFENLHFVRLSIAPVMKAAAGESPGRPSTRSVRDMRTPEKVATTTLSMRAAWPRLHDWEVVEGGSFNLAPEMRPVKLKGMVTNHAYLEDGEITTSLVQIIDEGQALARTLGTSYALGAPSAKFAAQLTAQGMRRPLRYYHDPVTRVAEQQARKALWAGRTRCASPHEVVNQPSSEAADSTASCNGQGPLPLQRRDSTLTASGEASGEAEEARASKEAEDFKQASFSSARRGPRPTPDEEPPPQQQPQVLRNLCFF